MRLPGHEGLEVTFAPPADLAEVLRQYPHAIGAEPLPELPAVPDCWRCAHVRRPGLQVRLCANPARDDLPIRYGLLRELPADGGEGCEHFAFSQAHQ